ncbi:MAG: FAD:protein FMN transferase, partial [Bacteroidales bacterium]|nr:FAD:protein FMN transferase [Bacteroidales bacterium]
MKRIFTILTILLLLIPSCRRNTGYVMIQGYAQGGTYTVKLNMDGVAVSPEKIREGIDSVLTLIDTTLSGYNKGSILSAFNRGEKVRPNPLFLDMYSLAYSWYERTEGAIDCAAGPVFDLWGFGFKSGEMPSDEDVRSAVASSGMGRLSKEISSLVGEDGFLNPSDIVLSGDAALPVLNYNAIAQGLSADMVAAYLSKLGVKDMLVDIGEIFCKGVNPDGRPWSVGIDRPVDGNNSPGADLEGVWRSKGTPCGIVTS